jgi:hypothetical protein
MSDYERGPYTPPSERLSFDPREPVRSGPAPVTLIVSALILVGIIGGVVLLYKGGIRHKGDAPTAVGAPVNALGTLPAADANATPPAALVIDKTDNGIAPAPIAPSAPPAAALPPQAPPAAVVAGPPPAATPVAATPPKPVATTAAAAPPVSPAKPPKPLTIASLADDAVRHPSAPLRPALPATPATAVSNTNPTGDTWAQIGAFSSAALADKGWGEIAHFDHTDMAGKGKQVEETTHNGATFYRTIVTGFSSHAAAVAFCDKLKAANKPCITK